MGQEPGDPAGHDRHPITGQFFPSPAPAGQGWPGDPAEDATAMATSSEDVRRLAESSATVATLDARISRCHACPRLVGWREHVATAARRAAYAAQPYWGRPVPSFGDPDAGLLIVGLAPAAHGANRTGRMFTGDRSGDWLYSALHRAGYAAQPTSVAADDGQRLIGARIVAAVRCAPPANAPTAPERHSCAPWLDADLRLAEPHLRCILALGGLAWDFTLAAARRARWQAPRPKPRFGHGVEARLVTTSGRDVRLLASYHVSQQNTFTGRLTTPMLDDILARTIPHRVHWRNE